MKSIRFILICLLLVSNSCRRIYEVELPAPQEQGQNDEIVISDKPILSDGAILLTKEAGDNILSFTDTELELSSLSNIKAVRGNSPNGRLAALSDIKEIHPGDVIVAEPSNKVENGFLLVVERIEPKGDGWVISYKDASLVDLFKSIHITAKLPRSREWSLNDVSFKTEAFDAAGRKVVFNAQFTGSLKREQTTNLEVVILDSRLKKYSSVTTEKTTTILNLKESAGVGSQLKPPKLFKIFNDKIPLPKIEIPIRTAVGIIPIVIKITLEPYAKLEAKVTSLSFDVDLIKQVQEKVTGYINEDGIEKNVDEIVRDEHGTFALNSVSVEGQIKASIGLAVNVCFYNQNRRRKPGEVFKGVTGELEMFGKLTASCNTQKGLETKLSGGFGGKIYADFDLYYATFKNEWPYKLGEEKVFSNQTLTGICNDEIPIDPIPIANNTQRTPTAVSTSDPHMKTFDQGVYDFMAAGEFVAAKSNTDKFEIQVRQQEIKASNASGQVSFNTGLAMHTGSDAVCIYPDGRIFVNQARINLTSNPYALRSGWSIQQTDNGVNILNMSGDQIEVRLFGTNLDFYTSLSAVRKGTLKGLLGNFDGNSTNDLVRGDNGQTIQNTFANLYPLFADSWRIKQAESLFVYDTGKNTDSYTDRTFPRQAITLTAQQRSSAEAVCKQQGITDPVALQNCITDVALTNDYSLAQRALDFQTAGNVLNSFAIGQFLTTDVQLAYSGATAENNAAVLNSASNGFSRVVMNQGVNIRNGFISEFSFTAEEFNPTSCFYLAFWPTSPDTRTLSQSRVGFCFAIDNGVASTFYQIISDSYGNKIAGKNTIAQFNDKQVHRVRISEKRLASGWFQVSIFYDNMNTPVVSVDNTQSIAQIIDAQQNTGFIEFQINQGAPTKVKVFNWTFQSL